MAKFEDLTWDDLTAWAGSRVVARGKSYRGNVEDLRVTADGRLLAWVQGGERYATVVSLPKKGKPDSVCTCPYGIDCKHAVATVLVYLEAMKAKKTVPAAEEDDERFEELADFEEDDDDGEDGVLRTMPAKPKESELDTYLARLSKDELLQVVQAALCEVPALRKRLADRAELAVADVVRLVKSARRAIQEASAEPGWTRHWSHESHIPDYTPVRERLEALLKAGQADEVVALGEELVDAGLRQLGQSDDEGETGHEVAECVGIVFRALARSSTPDAEKLLWERRVRMREDCGFFDGLPSLWKDGAFPAAVWSEVADALLKRVPSVPEGKLGSKADADSYSARYAREKIMRSAFEALERAGRKAEITDLLRREAEITQCYGELVDHLSALGLDDEADAWCRKGFAATIEKSPGLAKELARRLCEHAQKQGNSLLVAAYRAAEFFDGPDVETYKTLEKAVVPLNLWEPVRKGVLRWLETGARPDIPVDPAHQAAKAKGKRRKGEPSQSLPSNWPLPDTGLRSARTGNVYASWPKTNVLIQIAVLEKRNDDALAWYARVPKRDTYGWGYGYGDGLGGIVAEAVKETHPDAALDIWRKMSESEIARVNPAAYDVAGAYLEKMKKVYAHLGRTQEWTALIADLRAKNRPKRRLMEVFDRLEGIAKKAGKIID
jgi:uncharacterized Zn finger protein